ncbi:MAG: nitroreductase family protein [candidate division WOR-3 bacterium]
MDSRLAAIFARRSVREYTEEPLNEKDIQALLEAAMAAPSASNRKPWHFVVVTDRDKLKRLAEVHPHGKMLASARAAIAVCGDLATSPDFWVQDCSAATENILIAAAMLGLGAVWLGVHPRKEREQALKSELGIPEQFGLLCLIALGRPRVQPPPRTQFDPDRVHREGW